MSKPIGVSEYELTRALPLNLRSALPTVEAIEAELGAKAVNQFRGPSAGPAGSSNKKDGKKKRTSNTSTNRRRKK
jgi:hypothetical protein